MTKHKLDRVFKDKLEQFSVKPSQRANDRFESLLNKKKTPIWWYAAASAGLLMALSWWYWSNPEIDEITEMAVIESTEVRPETNMAEISEELKGRELAGNNVNQSPKNEVSEVNPEKSVDNLSTSVEEQEDDNAFEVDATELTNDHVAVLHNSLLQDSSGIENKIEIASLEVEQIISEDTGGDTLNNQPIPLPVVRITFKSGKKKKTLLAESKIPSDSAQVKNGAFNVILNSAKNLANGSLIADLRDAKENFFNRNDD